LLCRLTRPKEGFAVVPLNPFSIAVAEAQHELQLWVIWIRFDAAFERGKGFPQPVIGICPVRCIGGARLIEALLP
jgi:hypothetical protein